MSSIFDALPGIDVPVGSVNKGLSDMWTPEDRGAANASDEALAMQVNFLIYLGSQTTVEDAVTQFATMKQFSHRYPSRVVVLCPLPPGVGGPMRAKIYGECFIGKSRSDKRCIEFVVFSYPRDAREHLENQVFTCLSNDLPTYFWGHRFATSGALAAYGALIAASRRVIVDTAIAPADFETFAWPDPGSMRDLVFARTLPLRQGIGQFLSRYPMEQLCRGIRTVVVSHGSAHPAEGRVLMRWVKERISRCAGRPRIGDLGSLDEPEGDFRLEQGAGLKPGEFRVSFGYDDDRAFQWKCDVDTGRAEFDADFGTGRTRLPAGASLLPPDAALSEAMFFC